MLEKVKYDIGERVRAKVNYKNDPRKEVEGIICGVEIDGETNKIKYKINIELTEQDKNMGCAGGIGYISQEDILRMTDKERLEWLLQYHEHSSIEEIFMAYLWRWGNEFSAMRMKEFVDSLNKNYLYPMIKDLSSTRFVANERATWIKQYLEGKMWADEESAKRNLQPQIDNAQAIIDACKKQK